MRSWQAAAHPAVAPEQVRARGHDARAPESHRGGRERARGVPGGARGCHRGHVGQRHDGNGGVRRQPTEHRRRRRLGIRAVLRAGRVHARVARGHGREGGTRVAAGALRRARARDGGVGVPTPRRGPAAWGGGTPGRVHALRTAERSRRRGRRRRRRCEWTFRRRALLDVHRHGRQGRGQERGKEHLARGSRRRRGGQARAGPNRRLGGWRGADDHAGASLSRAIHVAGRRDRRAGAPREGQGCPAGHAGAARGKVSQGRVQAGARGGDGRRVASFGERGAEGSRGPRRDEPTTGRAPA